ncbi:MAG: ligase-associated DNA damage response exonuclease [Acidobacteriia bacterium]|nr:ligase-associated DNA damage response exonuclease [Terriglobia bacterium]
MALLELRASGLYCAPGDFYIDPWSPVDRAVITHAHSDHACPGSRAYLTPTTGASLLQFRVGPDPAIQTAGYGEPLTLGEVRVSLHPAGHILGSAQVRLEYRGEVWVVSGDYKLAPDPTCTPFEPLRCHTFVTESTFGLPVFRWPAAASVMDAIHAWWRANQEAGKASLLFAHALGKAQRLLAAIDPSIGPIHVHEAVDRVCQIYRQNRLPLAPTVPTAEWSRALVIAPPSCHGSAWTRSFGNASTALASGWMRIRGTRRRRSLDRGFVLSDHADWPALLRVIDETRAETVWVAHGYREPLARWLQEHGRRAVAVEARFEESAS